MRDTSNPDDKLDPRRWMALVILLTGAFLPPLDFFIVNVALPSIREDFRASASMMQLIISGYATTYAVMLITGGIEISMVDEMSFWLEWSGLQPHLPYAGLPGLQPRWSPAVSFRGLQRQLWHRKPWLPSMRFSQTTKNQKPSAFMP